MALNLGLSQLLVLIGLDYKISNAITLVTVKTFCYFTNKIFVFKTPFGSLKQVVAEAIRFVFARWLTFLVDYFGAILMVEVCNISFFYSKCFLSVLVVLLNYVFSKKLVFKK